MTSVEFAQMLEQVYDGPGAYDARVQTILGLIFEEAKK